MTMRHALPLLALTLAACSSTPKPRAIPVLAEAHRCPSFPLAPAELLKPPAKTDFLNPMHSPRPSRRSSSTT